MKDDQNFRGILCIKAWRVEKWSQDQYEFHVLPPDTYHTFLRLIAWKSQLEKQFPLTGLEVKFAFSLTFLVLSWGTVRGVERRGERDRGPGVGLPLQLSLLQVLLWAQLEAGQLKQNMRSDLSSCCGAAATELVLPAWHQLKQMIQINQHLKFDFVGDIKL